MNLKNIFSSVDEEIKDLKIGLCLFGFVSFIGGIVFTLKYNWKTAVVFVSVAVIILILLFITLLLETKLTLKQEKNKDRGERNV